MRLPRGGHPLGLFAALIVAAGLGCAKKGPPSGGPPDIEPPRVSAWVPDSAAANVLLDIRPTITFSEAMETRAAGEAVAIAPYIEIRQRRWSGRTLTLVLADSLRENQSYTLFVGGGALDRHGNPMATGAALTFTTGDSFPPGRIEGTVDARGFSAPGTYLWTYAEGREPDSTARDFDALGLADDDGAFRVAGLSTPGRYRIWAFADLNRNRSFEPDKDVLAQIDTVFSLTAENPEAKGVMLRALNPRAPGRVEGAVVDSTGDSLGVIRVVAIATEDSTRRVLLEAGDAGRFRFELQAGTYELRAWRDRDRNRQWRTDLEAASPLERVRVEPAGEVKDVVLILRRLLGGP